MAARLTAYVVVAIVAATLIAGLIVGAQRDDNDGPVDLIVHNASVYTADGEGTMAEAVAVRGNQVLRVGGEREILRLRRPQTVVIDAAGATVLPGFNDSHVHLMAGGLTLDKVNLLGAASVAEIQERIASWARANPDSEWVLGRGWRHEAFPDGLPTRQLLDALVPHRPAQLLSADGHTAWVNSAALKLARIGRRTPDPPHGIIVKDARTGEPTGVLKEAAMTLVGQLVPRPAKSERLNALRAAVGEAHRNGITSLQNAGSSADDLELFAEARRTGDLRVRVYSAISLGQEFTDEDSARLSQASRLYPDDPIFKTGAVKIRVDGVLPTGTAAMLGASPGGKGAAPLIPPDDLNRMIRLIDAQGWQVMSHAAGDRAIRMVLNAYAHAARSNPAPERGRRHRIEHAEVPDAEDIARFGALGVIASVQPALSSANAIWADSLKRRLGSRGYFTGWPYRSLSDARGRLAFGSDWPAADLNPLLGLHGAVTRPRDSGEPQAETASDQRLALEAAIDAYTSGAAWASFDEQRKGSLQPGMLADLVVLTDDIFDAKTTIAEARVAYTIFDGKIVYRRDRGSN